MTNLELTQTWVEKAREVLKGRTIVAVTYASERDIADSYFSKRGLRILLDNGTEIYPMADDEGNDFGAVHYMTKDGKFDILPTL
jgi:hypothetical protein